MDATSRAAFLAERAALVLPSILTTVTRSGVTAGPKEDLARGVLAFGVIAETLDATVSSCRTNDEVMITV